MKVGMFQTPFLRPELSASTVFDWAIRQAVVADEAGFTEYWVGEHAMMTWENIPNPELVIAAAGKATKKIKLGPLAHLVPYYHPASLAVQTAWLSQILEGRYMLGVAAGAYPTDAALRGLKDISANHDMLYEAIDIMERVWKAEPFHYEGKFWKAGYPEVPREKGVRDIRPYGGTMPLAMTGLSAPSPSITFAANRGYIPVSVYAGNAFLKNHFDTYKTISESKGRKYDPLIHHVVRDVVVADSDAEARRIAINGGLGKAWEVYVKPTYEKFGVLTSLLHDPSVHTSDVDANYLAEHVWIVGSPETVREKIEKWVHDLGQPFGTLLIYSHDYVDNPKPWEESMRRLAQEVMPKIKA